MGETKKGTACHPLVHALLCARTWRGRLRTVRGAAADSQMGQQENVNVLSDPIHDRHGPSPTMRTGGIKSVEPALLVARSGAAECRVGGSCVRVGTGVVAPRLLRRERPRVLGVAIGVLAAVTPHNDAGAEAGRCSVGAIRWRWAHAAGAL